MLGSKECKIGSLLDRALVECAVLCELFAYPCGNFKAALCHKLNDFCCTEVVKQLEGALYPVVAAAHCSIDILEAVADGVAYAHCKPDRLKEHSAHICGLGFFAEEHGAKSFALILNACNGLDNDLLCRYIFMLVVVPHKAVFADLLVVAAVCLIAEVAALNDVGEHLGNVAVGLLKLGNVGGVHILHCVDADVKTDEVHELEGTLLGTEDEVAGECIGIWQRIVEVCSCIHGACKCHGADTVCYKACSVLADDGGLAVAVVHKCRNLINGLTGSLCVMDKLHEVHIADGVKEVDTHEASLSVLCKAVDDGGNGDVRCVGADYGVLTAVVEDELHGAALNLQGFRNSLNDEVAVTEHICISFHICAEYACSDSCRIGVLHLALLDESLNSFGCALATCFLALPAYHKDNIKTCSCTAGGNCRAHSSCADNRQFSNSFTHGFPFQI